MKQIRKRLTYANVMSSIAVFIVLGGAAFAAVKLPKNSVGTKQLKKNAVTTQKIKNGAVTGAKVNVSGFPKVPSAVNADSAANAGHAANADNAANAANAANANHANEADAVAGSTIRRLFYSTEETTQKTVILSLDGLTLEATCEGGGPQLWATTSVPDSEIHAGGTYLFATAFYVERDNFDPGEEVNLLEEESDSVQGTLTYATPSGGVVTATFLSEEGGFSEFETDCIIAGHAIG